MAANLSLHLPIIPVSTISGNQEKIANFLEAASQTWPQGTVVALNGSGNTIIWSGTVATSTSQGTILGVSLIGGYNYASAGAGASPLYGSIGFPGGTPTFGTVLNQSAAVNLLHGSPFANGMSLVALATSDTIFEIQLDASSGTTYNATAALVGTQIGLTKDASNFWYADLGKVTQGTNTVATVVSLNPQDLVAGSATTQVNNGRIRITFNIQQTSVQGF
jgi:hypothetical protein